jgi:hypothetical protein
MRQFSKTINLSLNLIQNQPKQQDAIFRACQAFYTLQAIYKARYPHINKTGLQKLNQA